MALRSKSLFLYGFQVTDLNNAIDFKTSFGGPVLQGTIPLGFYSLTSLMVAIGNAMRAVAPSFTFTVSADRTFASGSQNRVTIATSGVFLSLLFGSGPRAASSVRSLIGFAASDQTGATSYQGTATAGIAVEPFWYGKNWQPPDLFQRNFGAVNVSTSGEKEAVVFAIQQFMSVQFDYEPESSTFSAWPDLIQWMIKQRPFDFTPEIGTPGTFYEVTLDRSGEDGKGLAFNMREMLPQYPFFFSTGPMTFRRIGVF